MYEGGLQCLHHQHFAVNLITSQIDTMYPKRHANNICSNKGFVISHVFSRHHYIYSFKTCRLLRGIQFSSTSNANRWDQTLDTKKPDNI